MALAKELVVDRIEINEDGSIGVRRATYITENGVRITDPIYSRVTYSPLDALPANEEARVKDVAAVIWTPAVKAAYRAKSERAANPVIPTP